MAAAAVVVDGYDDDGGGFCHSDTLCGHDLWRSRVK